MSKNIPYPLGPLDIEAKVLEEGVHFAWDVGVGEVIFECDSQIVAEAVNGSCKSPITIRNIVEGI